MRILHTEWLFEINQTIRYEDRMVIVEIEEGKTRELGKLLIV